MAENGLRPIGEIMPADIVVCGFPRSGHTWLQNLIAGIAFGVDPEFAPDALIQDLVPDLHYKRFYKRYGPTAYFKSHALPTPEYRRVVYLLRDGRDALVSYYHLMTALSGPMDWMRLARGEGVIPCPWHEHVERWLANPHGAEMLIVRYEDLLADTMRELKRLGAFAGLKRDDAGLERIAIQAGFAKAQEKERRLGWDNPNWPRDQPFIRRGQIGSWRDELPAAVLAEFMKQAGATLERVGYD